MTSWYSTCKTKKTCNPITQEISYAFPNLSYEDKITSIPNHPYMDFSFRRLLNPAVPFPRGRQLSRPLIDLPYPPPPPPPPPPGFKPPPHLTGVQSTHTYTRVVAVRAPISVIARARSGETRCPHGRLINPQTVHIMRHRCRTECAKCRP